MDEPSRWVTLSLNLFAHIIHWVGLSAYGLTLLGFAGQLWMRRGQRLAILERFQACGPLLGLSMGALIFGGISLHLLNYGLHWPDMNANGSRELLLKYGVFALLWVSSFHLEIWTLEPLRQRLGANDDPSEALAPIARQVQINAGLFLAVGALSLMNPA